MMLRPFVPRQTISGRLIWFSVLFATGSLVAASIILWLIVASVVREQVDQRLDLQVEGLRDALVTQSDGTIKLTGSFDAPPFDRIGSGWYWQVSGSGVRLSSRSLDAAAIESPPVPFDWRRALTGSPQLAEGKSATGQSLHVRVAKAFVGDKAVEILVTAPQTALSGPAFRALLWLVPAMLLLGAILVTGILYQVRYGLRPLRRLTSEIPMIGSGRLYELPPSEVGELQPVTVEINRLVSQNRKRLADTRLHFANLAHGLKTPVASLTLALNDDNDRTGEMRALVARVEGRIRHHLGRARGMLSDAGVGATAQIEPHIDDIIHMMSRLHADRTLTISRQPTADLSVGCAPEDVDEILGAIIDNAFKWARASVSVMTATEQTMALITVDDDGPGIKDDRIADAVRPGVRLDETVPGDGFGLSIAKELTEIYGGSLAFGKAPTGGLRVSIRLPRASA